jgi:DNA primase
MISKDTLLEIKQSVNLSQIVGLFAKLTYRGKRQSCLCPFHSEKTPSFFIDESDRFFYCFGCGAKGDSIEFVRKKLSLSFSEATEWICEKFKIPIKYTSDRNQSNLRLYKLLEDCENLLNRALGSCPTALDYLKSRSIKDETTQAFCLGFNPGTMYLSKSLLELNYNLNELFDLGLVCYSKNGRILDFFRDRLTIPLKDHRGKTVGFAGRVVSEGEPKYLNSKDSPIFKKSLILFNLSQVLKSSSKKVYLVEGYFDVISLHQAGLPAVCSCGSSISSEQIKMLEQFFDTVVFVFDGDNAGRKATFKAVLETANSRFSSKFILLPDGVDPDTFIRHSVADFQNLPQLDPEAALITSYLKLVGKDNFFELSRPEIWTLTSHIKSYLGSIMNPLARKVSEKNLKHALARLFQTSPKSTAFNLSLEQVLAMYKPLPDLTNAQSLSLSKSPKKPLIIIN